jgi:hypothetical protein
MREWLANAGATIAQPAREKVNSTIGCYDTHCCLVECI